MPSQSVSSKVVSGLSMTPGCTAGSSGLQSVATAPSPSQSGGSGIFAPAVATVAASAASGTASPNHRLTDIP